MFVVDRLGFFIQFVFYLFSFLLVLSFCGGVGLWFYRVVCFVFAAFFIGLAGNILCRNLFVSGGLGV